ncbi:MAG: hypothetical protein ACP5DX_05610 [Paracoccaceae bacterium]
MLKRARDGYFALGLIIGLLAATIFLVSIAHLEPSGSEQAQAEESQSGGEAAEQKYGKSYLRWSGLVSTEDTLAQWIMAFLSIVAVALSATAVWFVWKTLLATQKMADDTREIGEAQVRAYVRIIGGYVRLEPGDPVMTDKSIRPIIKIAVKNYGQSPAQWFRWTAMVRYYPPLHHSFRGTLDLSPESWGIDIGAGEGKNLPEMNIGSSSMVADDMAVFDLDECFMDIVIKYAFKDVFDENIEDERVFIAYLKPAKTGVDIPLRPHPLDRHAIERLTVENRSGMRVDFGEQHKE